MYTFINDRSDLDAVIAIKPGKDGNPTIKITRRMDLGGNGMPRNDVVLLSGNRSTKQYILSVAMQGFKGDLWILDILSDEEYQQVQDIAERMRKNAIEFPPAWKLL